MRKPLVLFYALCCLIALIATTWNAYSGLVRGEARRAISRRTYMVYGEAAKREAKVSAVISVLSLGMLGYLLVQHRRADE